MNARPFVTDPMSAIGLLAQNGPPAPSPRSCESRLAKIRLAQKQRDTKDPDFLFSNAIVWTHAGAGAIWIAACACFVIAGLAIEGGGGGDEQANFVRRAASRINQFAMIAAAAVLITGAINIAIFITKHPDLHAASALVLTAKLAIFAAMATALASATRAGTEAHDAVDRGTVAGPVQRMIRAHLTMVVLGGIAMVLGLWLAGS
jgi:hypothetical protein